MHETFVSMMGERAAEHGDREALVFCRRPGDKASDESLTYAELDEKARSIAAYLQTRFSVGDRVLLVHQPGLSFATSFLGCLYAGVIAVSAPAPDGYRNQRQRLAGTARQAQAAAVISDRRDVEEITSWIQDTGLEHTAVLCADGGGWADPADWKRPAIDAHTVAFLQYTSGSTSAPKGVVVDHANLLHNLESFRVATGVGAHTRFGGWLPMYHDLGLIGMLMAPLALGTCSVTMAPTAFLRRPHQWLNMIDRYDIGFSPSPNFGLDLCLRRVTDTQLATLDLSRWTHAAAGAEPIQAATLAGFAERFAPAGFRYEAFQPGYGMAEATLCLAVTPAAEPPTITTVDADRLGSGEFVPVPPDAPGRALVGNGPAAGCDLRIVDPHDGRVQPDGRVGEIWVRGGSIARGYWQQEEATRATFDATTAAGDGGFLRTGDLGVLHDGEVYVTGRIKDVLIVNGQNLYPQDFEFVARSADARLMDGVSAAFTVPVSDEPDDEELVIVQEVRARSVGAERLVEITTAIKTAITRELGVSMDGVVLVRPGHVGKTTSGKIQRRATREEFMRGRVAVVHAELSAALRNRYSVGHRDENDDRAPVGERA